MRRVDARSSDTGALAVSTTGPWQRIMAARGPRPFFASCLKQRSEPRGKGRPWSLPSCFRRSPLLLLIGVEFGGWSLLWFITSKRDVMDERRIQFFRAGHAHGGVLTILSLVYFVYLDRAGFSEGLQWVLGIGLIAGALAQSGGFFVHHGSEVLPTAPRLGTILTRTGAVGDRGSAHRPGRRPALEDMERAVAGTADTGGACPATGTAQLD